MNAYEQKQANRLARYERAAQLTEAAASAASNQASRMASVIPFGQPILIGHHSERGQHEQVAAEFRCDGPPRRHPADVPRPLDAERRRARRVGALVNDDVTSRGQSN